MKIVLLCVGKTDEDFVKKGCEVYLKRLQHYAKTEVIFIPDLKGVASLNPEQRNEKEGEQILKQLEETDRIILLDEGGEEFSSRKFSQYLQKQFNTGSKRIVFIIGGAFGFSEPIYAKSHGKLSLSKMTFNHQMIRMFFLEQIYRGFTILNNEPYHND